MASFEEIKVADDDAPRRSGLPPGIAPALWGLVGVVALGSVPYLWSADECIELSGTLAAEAADEGTGPESERKRICAGDLQVWIESDPAPFSNHFITGEERLAQAQETEHTGQEKAELKEHEKLEQGNRSKATFKIPVAPVTEPDAASSESTAVPTPKPTFRDLAKAIQLPKDWYEECQMTEGTEVCGPPTTRIVGGKGTLDSFYRSLALTLIDKLRGAPKGNITRISHWGDSAIVADGITSAVRRLMQDSFGDAGHGFILIDGGKSYMHKDVRHSVGTWSLSRIINRGDALKRYGFGGISARGYAGAWAKFGTVEEGPIGTRVSRFKIFHMNGPKQGQFTVSVDGDTVRTVDTRADVNVDGMTLIEVPDGPHQMKLRAKGPVRLYGVALERETPGVVYDSLGLLGARGSRLLDYDDGHLAEQFEFRDVALSVLMFGGNALRDRTSLESYEATFRELVQKFRKANPSGSCLVMSPLDHAERYRKRYRTIPRLLEIMPIQEKVARAEGCAYFSNFDAMGGEGSMEAWVRRKPPLAYADYAHLRPAGGKALGLRVFRALVYGFAEYLDSL